MTSIETGNRSPVEGGPAREFNDIVDPAHVRLSSLALGTDHDIGSIDFYQELLWGMRSGVVDARNNAVYYDSHEIDRSKRRFRTGAVIPVVVDIVDEDLADLSRYELEESGLYLLAAGNNTPLSETAVRTVNEGIEALNRGRPHGEAIQAFEERRACGENNLAQFFERARSGEFLETDGIRIRMPEFKVPLFLAGPSLTEHEGKNAGEPKYIEGCRNYHYEHGDVEVDVLYPCGEPCRPALTSAFGSELVVACFALEESSDRTIPTIAAKVGSFEKFNNDPASELFNYSEGDGMIDWIATDFAASNQ